MDRYVTIGTAGHVDHGKTALVKALTGTDTDRWEEEKRRGITIDLGFAALDLAGGVRASVVDVPGHEDFVRNMVAGATGIDMALLVVAADEGVMPQTVEHLAILEALDVRVGVPAITKTDLVDPDWLELVSADVAQRLSRSRIAWAQPVSLSSVTGQGLDQLRAALAHAATTAPQRDPNDLFRLPLDRVFSLPGAGTVVTGTAWSGSVEVGQEVRILPADLRGRVRTVQVHGQTLNRSVPGRRTALALAGIERADAERGSVVVADDAWRVTRTIDVVMSLLPDAPPVTQRSRLRLHLGTAEVITQVTPAAGNIEPGGSGVARLRLETPLVTRWGDRGVLRRYSPVTTIGGCIVLDPWPANRPRRPTVSADLAVGTATARVATIASLAASEGISVGDLAVRAGLPPAELGRALETDQVVRSGHRVFATQAIGLAQKAFLNAIAEFHRSHPLEPGIPREQLRQKVESPNLAELVERQLSSEGAIVLETGTARLPKFSASVDSSQAADRVSLEEALLAAGFEGRTVAELAGQLPPNRVQDLAEFLVRQGTAVRVGKDRYYNRGELEKLVRKVLLKIQQENEVTPAQLRELLGLTRKYLIPLLEWLDAQGLTVRVGDARRLGAAAHPMLKELGKES